MARPTHHDCMDLLADPWIPVRYVDGGTRDVGIITALTDRYRILDIATTSRAERLPLVRLLAVVLHEAGGNPQQNHPAHVVEAGLRRFHDQWRAHFDSRTFMQGPGNRKDKPTSAEKISTNKMNILCRSHAQILFGYDQHSPMSVAEGVRRLLTINLLMGYRNTVGLVKSSAAKLYVCPVAANLGHVLDLILTCVDEQRDDRRGDRPLWQHGPWSLSNRPEIRGWKSAFTYQAHDLRMITDGDQVLYFTAGKSAGEYVSHVAMSDPMHPYQKVDDDEDAFAAINKAKELRDAWLAADKKDENGKKLDEPKMPDYRSGLYEQHLHGALYGLSYFFGPPEHLPEDRRRLGLTALLDLEGEQPDADRRLLGWEVVARVTDVNSQTRALVEDHVSTPHGITAAYPYAQVWHEIDRWIWNCRAALNRLVETKRADGNPREGFGDVWVADITAHAMRRIKHAILGDPDGRGAEQLRRDLGLHIVRRMDERAAATPPHSWAPDRAGHYHAARHTILNAVRQHTDHGDNHNKEAA